MSANKPLEDHGFLWDDSPSATPDPTSTSDQQDMTVTATLNNGGESHEPRGVLYEHPTPETPAQSISTSHPVDQTRRKVTSLIEAAVLMGPFVHGTMATYLSPCCPQPGREGQYPCTDVVHPTANGGSLRNFGLYHGEEELQQYGDVYRKAIDSGDIILLEGGDPAKEENWFFNPLRDYALQRGKKVYDVDMKRDMLVALQTVLTTVGPAGIGALGLVNEFRYGDTPEMKIPRSPHRRTFLKILGWLGILAYLPISFDPFQEHNKYPDWTYSYITDGRTVKMLSETLSIVQKNPGKRVVLLSGNTHAAGIEHYLSSEETFAEFRKRKQIYDATYERIYGEKSKKITREDVDRTNQGE